MWQFVLPVCVFIVCYWRILGVIRRQAKVKMENIHLKPNQSAHDINQPSNPTDPPAIGSTTDLGASARHGSRRTEPQGAPVAKPVSTKVSRSSVNVVKTMILVTVCFVVCWGPISFYYLLINFQVSNTASMFQMVPDNLFNYLFI
jgi:hypothetical protein